MGVLTSRPAPASRDQGWSSRKTRPGLGSGSATATALFQKRIERRLSGSISARRTGWNSLGTFGCTVLDVTGQSPSALREAVAKGAMPPLVLMVDDCRAAHARMSARGVEFTQGPVDRHGAIDASFRDPSGNGRKLIAARRGS